MIGRRPALALSGAAAAIGVGAALAIGGAPAGFPLDDAWIHLVYARSLAHGAPMSFDPGETASGATSPLWVVLLAIVHAALEPVSVDAIVRGVQALGAVAHLACGVLGAEAVWRWARDPIAAAIAGIAIGVAPSLACAALSGMEVCATAAALLAALVCFARGNALATGAALAVALALRPESGAIAIVLAGCAIAARGRAAGREVAIAAIPIAITGIAIAGADLAASGRPLPATFYFKEQASLAAVLPRLAIALLDMLPRSAPFAGCAGYLFALGALAAPGRAQLRASVPLLAAAAWTLSFAILVAPDPAAFYHLRYLLPGAPLLIVSLAIGAHHLGARVPRWRHVPALALGAIAIVGALLTTRPVAEHHASDVRNVEEVQRAIGERLRAITREGDRIAATDVGAVRYFSGRPVVDLMGLNTPDLYWDRDAYVRAHPVTHVAYTPSWLTPGRGDLLEEVAAYEARPYTLSSEAAAARQVIAACRADGRLPMRGLRDVAIVCAAAPR